MGPPLVLSYMLGGGRLDLVGDDLLHLHDRLGEGRDAFRQLLRCHGVLVELQSERPA